MHVEKKNIQAIQATFKVTSAVDIVDLMPLVDKNTEEQEL